MDLSTYDALQKKRALYDKAFKEMTTSGVEAERLIGKNYSGQEIKAILKEQSMERFGSKC